MLAVGDGALGFWKALAEVFPETRGQRCWVHKSANVLDAMLEIPQGGQEDHRRPGPAAGVLRLPGRALDPPTHTNPIESTFSTVRLRTKVTRGAGSRTAAWPWGSSSSSPPSSGGGP